jgi:hypothetical protein
MTLLVRAELVLDARYASAAEGSNSVTGAILRPPMKLTCRSQWLIAEIISDVIEWSCAETVSQPQLSTVERDGTASRDGCQGEGMACG